MPNNTRRKLKRQALGAYISPAQRHANKVEGGKSVRPLTDIGRRHVHRMNQYYGTDAATWVHPPELCA